MPGTVLRLSPGLALVSLLPLGIRLDALRAFRAGLRLALRGVA